MEREVEEEFFAQQRDYMVDEHLRQRDIRDRRVLAAMRQVPRHLFVPAEHRRLAYADSPLPIGGGQTISQPYIVAYMTQLLRLQGSERVLEIGTGSGYQAAVLATLAWEVFSVERRSQLADLARENLERLGYRNVNIFLGDGTHGLPAFAPYNGIIVTAGAPQVPQPLLAQLDEGGRLVIPVGSYANQSLQVWLRTGEEYQVRKAMPVAFVPLTGEFGWKK